MDWTGALQAGIGVVATLAGVSVTHYLTHKREREKDLRNDARERAALYRQKLERLLALVGDHEEEMGNRTLLVLKADIGSPLNHEVLARILAYPSQLREASQIQLLYFPELKEPLAKLHASTIEVGQTQVDTSIALMRSGNVEECTVALKNLQGTAKRMLDDFKSQKLILMDTASKIAARLDAQQFSSADQRKWLRNN